MDWFAAAVLATLLLSGQSLAFQRLQRHYPIKVYMTYMWLGSAVLLSVIYLRPSDIQPIFDNIVMLIVASAASWGGNYAYNHAIRTQNNLGYIEAVASVRVVITYVYSLIAFNAGVELLPLVGIIFVLGGAFAVAGTYRIQREDLQLNWISWALAAGVILAVLIISSRAALDGGVTPEAGLIVILVVAGVSFLASCLSDGTSLRVAPEHRITMLAATLFAALGNAALYTAFATTPNLAYAVAIESSRIILLYIAGLLLFGEPLRRRKAIGVIVTFIGVVLLN